MSKNKKPKNETQEYLSQIRLYDTHIRNKLADLANMEDLALKITSVLKPVSSARTGEVHDKVGDAASEIVDLQQALKKDIGMYRKKKEAITSVIDQVKDARELDVLQSC